MQTLTKLLSLLSEANTHEAEQAVSASPTDFWEPGFFVVCAVGLSVLTIWLLAYGGFGALRDAPLRRNRMFGFVPMFILFAWLLLDFVIISIVEAVFKDFSAAWRDAAMYIPMAVERVFLIVMMLFISHRTFARRLKGFGLNIRTMGKDAGFAAVYLLAVYPLVLFALWAVLLIGRLIDPGFNIEEHQTLTFLAENGNLALEILTIFFAIVIVPVFEELLFRGLLQSALRSALPNSWLVIILTSVFFAFMHYPNYSHMPSLFLLSCGLGYAYERSGSLFRPIFMHVLFNGLSVAFTVFFS